MVHDYTIGVVNKLDRAQRLALVEYQLIHEDDKSDARCQVWFRIDDQIRALQPSEPLGIISTLASFVVAAVIIIYHVWLNRYGTNCDMSHLMVACILRCMRT